MYNEKFAVVDLETTGNNKDRDNIIQLSIVFIDRLQITSQFTIFLSDDTDLTPFIRELTSIEPEMLYGAPKFQDIADDLLEMMHGYTFVAHNINFDLNFLKSHFKKVGRHFQPLTVIDTVELSKIFLPTLMRYQLSEITEALDIHLENAHRADADALATSEILIYIIKKMLATNSDSLKTLYHLAKHLKNDIDALIFSVVADVTVRPDNALEKHHNFYIRQKHIHKKTVKPMTVDEIYDKYIDNAQENFREDQLVLARELFHRFESKKHLALEAYTGLGKTAAFLIAAISYESMYHEKVLISTSRKILQNQMMDDAFNKIKKSLDTQVSANNFKGKDNYIDLEAFNTLLNSDDNNHEITLLKMKLLMWLLETTTGDLSEVSLKGPELGYYQTMLIQSGHTDYHFFYERALAEAEASNLIFTNHYFLKDCLDILSAVDILIVDEAHQLKQAVEKRFEVTYSYQDIKFFVGQIGSIEQDRLLTSYIMNNKNASQYLLQDLIYKLNQNVDQFFTALQENNISNAIELINQAIHFTSVFLGTIRNTNDYQALYNHVYYYQEILTTLKNGFNKDLCTVEPEKNFQLMKITLTYSDMTAIHQKLAALSSIVLLSGTLEVRGSFKHLDFWFNGLEYDHQIISLPSLHDNTKLFIPKDIPEYSANDEEYYYALVEYLSIYLYETDSKMMVLFSNYDLLQKIYDITKETGLFDDFVVLKQTKSTSADKLLIQYNQLERSLLLATTSFSEGINIEGTNDKCVMLSKLPFPVPNVQDYKSFYQNDLPEAVFRFRQIIGRVRRGPDDKGLILLMDNRIQTKNYKNAFLKYFPKENIIEGDRKTFKAYLSHL